MRYAGGRIVLALDALLFGAFGALYCVIPAQMADKVGVAMRTGAAIVDVQGIYGGLELGLGIFLGFCARDPERTRVGLLAASCALIAIALSRALAVARFGLPDASVAALLGLDVLGAVLNLFFLLRYRSAADAR